MAQATMRRREKRKERLPQIEVSEALFHTLCVYLISEYRSRSFVSKLAQFFHMVDCTPYKEDNDVSLMFQFVELFIQIVLEHDIKDSELILQKILEHPTDSEDFQELIENDLLDGLAEMDSNLATYVENEFIARINYITIGPLLKELETSVSAFKSGAYENYEAGVGMLTKTASALVKGTLARSSTSLSLPDIYTTTEEEERKALASLTTTIKRMNDPKVAIKTGIKELNRMLGGGFQPGNAYVFNGSSGGWKSGMLLNVILWALKYNDGIRVNDQAKRPCALYVTQENDVQQTMERIISYVRGVEKGKPKSDDEVLSLFRDEKIIGSRWTYAIVYRPKGSISTGDLDTIINEVEASGNVEVKLLVHDYIKRIRPDFPTGDIRIDLGEVMNDMEILAKRRRIPVVTANQLNREATRVLNPEDGKGKDLVKRINSSHLSESSMIFENCAAAIAIHREKSSADNRIYLTFKNLKDRNETSGNIITDNYFAHPFEPGNGMRLQEDLGCAESYSVKSLGETIVVDEGNDEEGEAVVVQSASERRNAAQNLNLDEE